jgi:hypothetical protein
LAGDIENAFYLNPTSMVASLYPRQ